MIKGIHQQQQPANFFIYLEKGPHFVALAGLELRDLFASASWVLELKERAMDCKLYCKEAGDMMAHQLKAPIAWQRRSSAPSTHVRRLTTTCNASSRESHTSAHTCNPHRDKKKLKLTFKIHTINKSHLFIHSDLSRTYNSWCQLLCFSHSIFLACNLILCSIGSAPEACSGCHSYRNIIISERDKSIPTLSWLSTWNPLSLAPRFFQAPNTFSPAWQPVFGER